MFDIGFWELGLIAVIALMILGPERLPLVARKAGMWVGKMKSMVNEVKTNINEELRVEELNALKQAGKDLKKDLDMTKNELGSVGNEFRKSVDEVSGVTGSIDTERVDIAAAISQSAPIHDEVTSTKDKSETVSTAPENKPGNTPGITPEKKPDKKLDKKPGRKKDKPTKSRSAGKSASSGKIGSPDAPVQTKSTATGKSTKNRKKPKKSGNESAKSGAG
jgi:sec-independent protein translocase protein TatB